MLSSLSTFFYRISSWKTLLLGIVLYVPLAYILKNLGARMTELAGHEVAPIDVLIGYDPVRVQQMIEAYGPEVRALYAQGELTADIAYPFIYTFLLCVILTMLFRHYASFRLVNVVPVGIFCFDLLENGCIVYLLKAYPNSSDVAASLCSGLTNLKWTMTMIVLGLVIYGLVKQLLKSGQRRLGNTRGERLRR